jgi:hypothetical protein
VGLEIIHPMIQASAAPSSKAPIEVMTINCCVEAIRPSVAWLICFCSAIPDFLMLTASVPID